MFVHEWKEAIIRPLLKKGLALELANYRPVSNLTFMSKVLEKCALQQFNTHCGENSLMPKYQSAYRSNFSCETALVKIVDDILNDMECQRVTALVGIDLSAAFDTVDHDILLSVLQNRFGICDNALRWFLTYLAPRCCKVEVNSQY